MNESFSEPGKIRPMQLSSVLVREGRWQDRYHSKDFDFLKRLNDLFCYHHMLQARIQFFLGILSPVIDGQDNLQLHFVSIFVGKN